MSDIIKTQNQISGYTEFFQTFLHFQRHSAKNEEKAFVELPNPETPALGIGTITNNNAVNGRYRQNFHQKKTTANILVMHYTVGKK